MFTVRNLGTAPTSTAVAVIDTLPAGLTFVTGSGAGWTFTTSGAVVTATRAAAIGVGGLSSFTLTVSCRSRRVSRGHELGGRRSSRAMATRRTIATSIPRS
jgi:hypothetical protein